VQVTVSYYEWLKNRTHVRFGRLVRRQEEDAKIAFLDALRFEGKQLSLTKEEKRLVVRGPEEQDLVRSVLYPFTLNH
jgi:glutamate dehydrogenase (NAD(P)+)